MTSDSQRKEERNALRAELELLRKQNEQYKERLQDLERQLIQLLRNGRGRTAAERDVYAGPGLFDAPPAGGGLAEPEEPEAPEDPPQDPPPNRPGSGSSGADGAQSKRGRKPPPAHVPREEQLHRVNLDELPGYDPKNGQQELSWETSEQLRFIPAQFVVAVHKRQVIVYTDAAGEARIVAADGPSKILGKGLPHETALAKIASDKYYLHLPLYRMTQAFAQLGYEQGGQQGGQQGTELFSRGQQGGQQGTELFSRGQQGANKGANKGQSSFRGNPASTRHVYQRD